MFGLFFVGRCQKSCASALVLFLVVVSCFSSILLSSSFLFASTDPIFSLDSVTHDAVSQNLHEHRYWQKLLHSKGGDGGPFTDDKSETVLIDTLKAFAQPLIKSSDADTHAQCLFPARLAWLNEQLHLFQRGLPKISCPRLQQWKTSLYPDSVSVVFASYYLSNPASMFGHTLLRLNQRQHQGVGLLDYGVNYAANVTTKNPLLYAVFGIAGGFNGQFASFPYYMKVLEYGHLESRDLWEYELNLSPVEINRLMDHLWEIRLVPLDYYFFSKNCSYYMLELLEVARPSLQILDSHRPWVIPADTVRWLAAEPELIKEIHFRPSAINLLHDRQKEMNSAQKRVLFSVLDNLSKSQDRHFVQNIDGFASDLQSPKEKALVWEAVIDYLLHIKNTRADKLDEREQWTLDESLRLRSRIPNADEGMVGKMESPAPLHLSPHQAHRSFRLTSRVGWGEVGGEYFQFEVHPAFHDLMAYDAGYPPYSQIEVMGLHGRFYFGLTESRKAVFKIQKF